MKHSIDAVLEWLGEDLSVAARTQLAAFADWLRTEAAGAGGIGPGEPARLEDRHLADSLAFAAGLDGRETTILDVGSGAGLPGIPLAILRPGAAVTLLDRSGRRTDLAARAIRVVGVENAEAIVGDVDHWNRRSEGIVMRAVFGPVRALATIARLLAPGGSAVVAVRRGDPEPDLRPHLEAAAAVAMTVEPIVVSVLDSPATLLRITHT